MKRKRQSEEKIISILKEHEAAASVPDIARRYEIGPRGSLTTRSVSGAPLRNPQALLDALLIDRAVAQEFSRNFVPFETEDKNTRFGCSNLTRVVALICSSFFSWQRYSGG